MNYALYSTVSLKFYSTSNKNQRLILYSYKNSVYYTDINICTKAHSSFNKHNPNKNCKYETKNKLLSEVSSVTLEYLNIHITKTLFTYLKMRKEDRLKGAKKGRSPGT